MTGREMDCVDVVVRLHDFASGRLPQAERVKVLKHLRDCRTCAALMVGMRGAKETVAPRPEPESSAAPPSRRAGRVLVRFAQVCVFLLLAGVAFLAITDRARLGRLFRGESRRSGPLVTTTTQPPSAPRLPERVLLLREVSDVLGEIAFGGGGPEISDRIAQTKLTARVRELRAAEGVPDWARSALARIEAVLLRAEAAREDTDEWEDVRGLILEEELVRASADVLAYFETTSSAASQHVS